VVTTADFTARAQSHTAEPLHAFFTAWLYEPALPPMPVQPEPEPEALPEPVALPGPAPEPVPEPVAEASVPAVAAQPERRRWPRWGQTP